MHLIGPRERHHFECAAVTPKQIEEWRLPTQPTKREGNTHANGFTGDSVELDAIPASRLRQAIGELGGPPTEARH